MYTTILALHSWVRWLVLLAGVAATLAAVLDKSAATGGRADRFGLVFMMAADVQMLLGLLLYLVLSPFTAEAFKNFGLAMQDPKLRFWAVEHITMMLIAVILIHVGRVLARKAGTPASRRTRQIACFGFATLLMLAGTPWPGMPNGRPLFRF